MKKGIYALFILAAGAYYAHAGVYVGWGVGYGIGVGGWGGWGGTTARTTTTTTTTTAIPQKKPEFQIGSYAGGEYPFSASEAAWILAKTNIITGAALGDRAGLSEQSFAMASLLYKADEYDARTTFKEIFNVSSEMEGKLYGLMGMKLMGDDEGFIERAKLLDPNSNVNCLVNGKFYVVTVETFLKAFDRNPYTFAPSSFPETQIEWKEPAQTTSESSTTSTTTTTSSVVYDYFPGYYWGPSYVVINVRPRPPRPRPPHPRPPGGRPPHVGPRPTPSNPRPGSRPPGSGGPRPSTPGASRPQDRPRPSNPGASRPQDRPRPSTPGGSSRPTPSNPGQSRPQDRPRPSTPQQRPSTGNRPTTRPSPAPSQESRPSPRPSQSGGSRPTTRPVQQSRPAPQPRAEARPAPQPRMESRPAPQPRAEPRQAPSAGRPGPGNRR